MLFASVRARLIVLVALSTLPAFGVMMHSAWRDANERVAEVHASLQASAARTAAAVDADLRGTVLLLQALAQLPEVGRAAAGSCERLVAPIVRPLKRYSSVIVMRPDGAPACATIALPGGINFSDREYFRAALAVKHAVLGTPVISRARGAAVLPVALAVRDGSAHVTAVVVTSLDVAWYQQFEPGTQLYRGFAVTWWDRQANIVHHHPHPEKLQGRSPTDTPLGRAVRETPAGGTAQALGVDGVERVHGFAPLAEMGGAGVKIALSVPLEELIATNRDEFARDAGLLALVMLGAFGAAWLLSEALIRKPLIQLSGVADRIGAGDLDARVGAPYAPHEFGVLAKRFDAMAAEVKAQQDNLRRTNAELEERISEGKRLQDDIRRLNAELEQRVQVRTHELEEANKELESFSYSVSHDLRAPLRHVQGYVEMLAEDAKGELSVKARRYLQTIAEASTEMGVLIDDLLAFSRMGRVEMHQASVHLDGLVRESIRSLEMATRGRTIDWHIAPLPVVMADASMLRQVFANLLGNAVKYTRPREQARIEIGCAGEKNGQHILFVRDNGVGFDMKYAHKLFGVFQRLHRADEFEGTGIGLANVRRVIIRHGGRVWAEGRMNAGATFYFTLKPATPA